MRCLTFYRKVTEELRDSEIVSLSTSRHKAITPETVKMDKIPRKRSRNSLGSWDTFHSISKHIIEARVGMSLQTSISAACWSSKITPFTGCNKT